jgi:hypothetical protein
MPKKSSSKKKAVIARSKFPKPRIPDVPDRTVKALAHFRLAQRFVGPILAAGVLVDQEDGYDDHAVTLADTLGGRDYQAMFNKYETFLSAKGVPNHQIDECTLFDIFYGYANYRARAAYLIGVAVGQRLGPNAFDVAGGDR